MEIPRYVEEPGLGFYLAGGCSEKYAVHTGVPLAFECQ